MKTRLNYVLVLVLQIVNYFEFLEAILTEGNIADAYLTFPEFCIKHGYPVETHTVETKDGYLLTNFRIPFSRKSPRTHKRKRAVLLQHGLMASADCFVLNEPEKNLAFILADAGYDVWLNNARGVPYSQRHIKYTPKDKEFWRFSFHEMGVYDIPAVIYYILRKTGEKQITYVGHSMGTTMFWIAMSTYPELNEKIRVMVALAPIAYMWHSKAPMVRMMSPLLHYTPNEMWVKAFSMDGQAHGEFSPRGRLIQLATVCESQFSFGCGSMYFTVFGFDPLQLNETQLPVYLGHFPTSTSANTFLHYGQLYNSHRFCQFDHGSKGNLKRYGQVMPPSYDLSKVTAKVVLFWSINDYLSDSIDVFMLARELSNLVDVHRVRWPKFNHGDYMTAIDINPLLHDPLMKVLRQN